LTDAFTLGVPVTHPNPSHDPYAPPPPHKERSGKLVRVVILASVIGVAAAGYALYADEIEEASRNPMVQEEQQMADGGAVTPSDSDFAPPAADAPAAEQAPASREEP
jgi:hypothetical protein